MSIVTHLHYDHAGNLDRFPNARFHLQDREMSYATGRCMCHGMLRHPFSADHVTLMVRHVYSERVTFHNGDGEVAPGVTLHRVGGHSDGLQVVRVETARGPVVLASDASHYYGNMQRKNPFPILYNLGDMMEGWEIVKRLAGHPDRAIPGHDPLVTRDLSPRQRQGRCLCAASAAVAFVRVNRAESSDGTIQDHRLHRPRRDGRADLPQPREEERRARGRVRPCAGAAGAAA